MNRNVTASFGLSVLIVLFFAVVLYQRDPPAEPPNPSATAEPHPSSAADPSTAPPPIVASTVATTAEIERLPSPAPPVSVAADRSAVPVARTVSRQIVAPVVEREPRGAFTKTRAGESLAQVARRVYGTAGSARALWMANRDVLDRADSPLQPGTLLRTP